MIENGAILTHRRRIIEDNARLSVEALPVALYDSIKRIFGRVSIARLLRFV